MKKVFSKSMAILLTLVMIVSFMPTNAAKAIWDDLTVNDVFHESLSSPIIAVNNWDIDSIDDFETATAVITPHSTTTGVIDVHDQLSLNHHLFYNNTRGRTIRLTNNITITNLNDWHNTSLSGDVANFTLDGNGYTITLNHVARQQ